MISRDPRNRELGPSWKSWLAAGVSFAGVLLALALFTDLSNKTLLAIGLIGTVGLSAIAAVEDSRHLRRAMVQDKPFEKEPEAEGTAALAIQAEKAEEETASPFRAERGLGPAVAALLAQHPDVEPVRLSVRQAAIAALYAEGHTVREIAQQLNISSGTATRELRAVIDSARSLVERQTEGLD